MEKKFPFNWCILFVCLFPFHYYREYVGNQLSTKAFICYRENWQGFHIGFDEHASSLPRTTLLCIFVIRPLVSGSIMLCSSLLPERGLNGTTELLSYYFRKFFQSKSRKDENRLFSLFFFLK